MEMYIVSYIVIAALVIFGLGVAYLVIRRQMSEQKVRIAEETAKRMIEDAKKDAERVAREARVEAKDELIRMKAEVERDAKERKNEITTLERRIQSREDHLENKEKNLDSREKATKRAEEESLKLKETLQKSRDLLVAELEKVAALSREEAKQELLSRLDKELEADAAKRIRANEEEVKKESEKRAREIVATAIQRCAVDVVVETTTSLVELPSDDLKGRIIGREGRNIRAFETQTGVDLIVDDTPEAVLLSSFDPLRRETAKITLQKLIADGRIHPARVEEMVEKARQELKAAMWEKGEQAALETGVHGLPPVLIQLLGRLHYRTSYGQNVLRHSVEMAHLAGMMATELGVNVNLAKRSALLHDIGKAVDMESEGTHTRLGVMLAEKAGETPEVIHGIEAHHGDVEPRTVEAILVQVADAISSARPGARRDTLEAYVKRLEKLEAVAKSFDGVEKVYAISAGREVRVIVEPNRISDDAAVKLAHDIAKKVEAEMEYPGEVRVTVIRETRASDVAK